MRCADARWGSTHVSEGDTISSDRLTKDAHTLPPISKGSQSKVSGIPSYFPLPMLICAASALPRRGSVSNASPLELHVAGTQGKVNVCTMHGSNSGGSLF